jgi:hypothetical protein
MRTSTAYFAGVGTVIVAISAGLGGGYLAANIANPPSPGVSKLERRMSSEPISVAAAPTQPEPREVVPNPASAPAPEQPQAHPQTEPATSPAINVRAEEKAVSNDAAAQPAPLASPPAKSAEPKPAEPAAEKPAASREAFAKARDADVKRAEAGKRRAERRQAWAERRRVQQPRDQELEAVEESVREVTEPRRIRIREEAEPRAMFAEQPSRGDMPRIRLFDRGD